jgi:hypothetical protein
MVDAAREYWNPSARWLAARYPELYRLKLHVVVPGVAVSSALAALAAKATSVRLDAVSDFGERLGWGLVGSLVVGLVWGYFVCRDASRFWPERGVTRYVVLLAMAGCSLGMTAPTLIYTRMLVTAELRYAIQIDAQRLYAAYTSLEEVTPNTWPDAGNPNAGRTDALKAGQAIQSVDEATYARRLKEWLDAIRPLTAHPIACPAQYATPGRCVGYDLPARLRELAWIDGSDRNFDRFIAVGATGAGLLLATLMVLRETTTRFGLIAFGGFVGYFAAWILAFDTFGISSARLGQVAFAHWCALFVIVGVQWLRRSSSWFARIASVMLALLTPFLYLAWALLRKRADDDEYVLFLIRSCLLYVLFFPFVHGNLVRLRYLPRP